MNSNRGDSALNTRNDAAATARDALQRDWSVIPVRLNKRPAVPTWKEFQQRRASVEEFETWAARNPAAWGVVTGAISGIVVLDFDGPAAQEAVNANGLEPHVRTGSGAYHVFLKHPGWPVPTVNGRIKRELSARFPDIDIRADGGYAVFAGRNASGTYEWLRPPEPDILEILPDDLRRAFHLDAPRTSHNGMNGSVAASLLATALQRGDGRNNAGFWLACQLRDNQLSMAEAQSVMRSYVDRTPPTNGKGDVEPYTWAEAWASLEQAYSRPPRKSRQESRAADQGFDSSRVIPPRFEFRSDGLYRLLPRQEGTGYDAMFLCGPIEVVSRTRDAVGQDWGKLLRFQDPDGRVHEHVMPDALLASDRGEWRSSLLRLGLRISPAKPAQGYLRDFLFSVDTTARAVKVDQNGWFGDVFVTPAWTIPGDTPEWIVLDDQGEVEHHFGTNGTLEEWQERISSRCVGNPLLVFAVSAAFAPALLNIRSGHGGGFHLASCSSTGKTSTLLVAGSVWGGGGKHGFIQSWNSTPNGLEGLARCHNHALLCLDELKELPAEQAGRIVYELANGHGRARMRKDARSVRRSTWELVFLSTGEFGFLAHIQTVDRRAYAGQEVRVCEIPADNYRFGGFDELHNTEDAATFAQTIAQEAREYYGTAAPAFIAAILRQGRDGVKCRVDALMRIFRDRNVGPARSPR
jgi:Domain of unknown function (DUF927)/Bifunctional DNA primase/polymerase, N-terminal